MASGEQGRYGLLLLTLIATYLISAVVTRSTWSVVIHVAFIAAIALLALRHTRLGPRTALAAQGATVASAIGAAVCAAIAHDGTLAAVADAWGGFMLLVTVTIIVEGVVRLNQVTAQSLYAAFSAYMLIGLMFAAFFAATSDVVSGPFFANGQPTNGQTLQYFSFVTLTTLGYGDFTAAGSLGRSVAVLEALAGQVFLATLVARLVSAYGVSRRPPNGE